MINESVIVAIIEARMNSSRLPGKHMLQANGKPMIQHLIERLQSVSVIDEIVLATTCNPSDDILIDVADKTSVGAFRGSEDDVLGRVVAAAEDFGADVIVGITGDCPVIDPLLVEQAILMFGHNSCSYLSNCFVPGLPGGMNTQVYSLLSLKMSAEMTNDPLDHEHVTSHMVRNPELFPPIYIVPPPDLHWPELVLELDEEVDYQFLKKIIEYFGDQDPLFSCREIINLLKAHPEWLDINRNTRRKSFE